MGLKTPEEIARMRKAGLLLWETHMIAKQMVKAGISTAEINKEIDNYIISKNAYPVFKGVPGKVPYPAASCISIDDEVVHGIPSGRIVRKGEIVSIDIGVKLNGWCADSAVTWPVGEISKEKQKLIQVTEDTLRSAIGHLNINTTWRQIARMMQAKVAKEGFSVVEDLVGHAIGEQMWEAPQIPNYFTTRMPDFRILPGLVFAIEPMINMGTKKVVICDDYWTIVTDDGLPSAHFEHTVAITEDGPIVLTCGPNGEGWAM